MFTAFSLQFITLYDGLIRCEIIYGYTSDIDRGLHREENIKE